MAEIDPITQEALRRAAQMRSRPVPKTPRHTESGAPKVQKPLREEKESIEKNQSSINLNDPVKAFFRDKEESIILLLVMLLMDEKADPSLLLALMYLLI